MLDVACAYLGHSEYLKRKIVRVMYAIACATWIQRVPRKERIHNARLSDALTKERLLILMFVGHDWKLLWLLESVWFLSELKIDWEPSI